MQQSTRRITTNLLLLQRHAPWLLPLLCLLLITPWISQWDLQISNYFYMPGKGFSQLPHFHWIFTYGPWPGLTLSIGSFALFLLSYGMTSLKRWRNPALLLTLTMAIGSGLIVHVLLKDHWGRPRPKQIEQFGGKQQFRPYYRPNFFEQKEPAKSFPCGHCSTGFYFFALALIAKRSGNKRLFYSTLLLALLLGAGLSLARIAQGGHFLSDVLISGLIMWLTAYVLARWLLKSEVA